MQLAIISPLKRRSNSQFHRLIWSSTMEHEELVGRVQRIIQCTAHHSPFTTEDSVWRECTLPPSLPSQGDSRGPLLLDQTAGTIGRKVQKGVDGCLFILVFVFLLDLTLISSKAPIHRYLGWPRCAVSHFAHAAACWENFHLCTHQPPTASSLPSLHLPLASQHVQDISYSSLVSHLPYLRSQVSKDQPHIFSLAEWANQDLCFWWSQEKMRL